MGMVAGMTTYVLDRSGFDFAQLPVVGAFWDTSKEDADETLSISAQQYFCHFFSKRTRRKAFNNRDSVDEEGVASPQYIETAMRVLGAWDVVMGGVLLSSMYMPHVQPLRLWLGGSLLLGFPT